MGSLRTLARWIRSWQGRRRWHVGKVITSIHDLPPQIPYGVAVLVANGRIMKWLAFDCPCREDHQVLLNLNPSIHPNWTVKASKPLTVTPSIDELRGGKRCHYFIRDGRIEWT